MRIQIITPDGARLIETDGGWPRRVGGPAIPCHRCGLCCERWQPLLTPDDAARLAAFVGVPVADFHATYTRPYPLDDEQRLLRRTEERCIFLRYEEGRAACAVHPARPRVCRDWAAGLDKKECVKGLARFAGPDGLIQLEELYPEPADRAAFVGSGAL